MKLIPVLQRCFADLPVPGRTALGLGPVSRVWDEGLPTGVWRWSGQAGPLSFHSLASKTSAMWVCWSWVIWGVVFVSH